MQFLLTIPEREAGRIERLRREVLAVSPAGSSFELQRPNLVVVTVEGGLVQAVNVERQAEARVVVVDFDIEGVGPDHPEVLGLHAPTGPGDDPENPRVERAAVREVYTEAMEPLARRWVNAMDAMQVPEA